MQKKLFIAFLASLMVSGGIFGAGAEKKAEMAKGQNCINARLLQSVLREGKLGLDIYNNPDLNGVDNNGITVLMMAAEQNKNPDVVRALLSDELYRAAAASGRGVTGGKINANAKDNEGANALSYALDNVYLRERSTKKEALKTVTEMVKALLRAGADPLNKPEDRSSPLESIKASAKYDIEYQELLAWMLQTGYAPSQQAPGGPKIIE